MGKTFIALMNRLVQNTLFYVCLILQPAVTTALNLPQDLPQEQLIPGGIAILTIQRTDKSRQEPNVYFKQKKVTLIQDNKQQWKALVGLPLSLQAGKQTVSIHWPDGKKSKQSFYVKQHDYPIQHLTIKDKNKVDPSAEDMQRIIKETARIKKAKSSWLNNIPELSMQLPVSGRLSSQFGLKRTMNGSPKNPHGGLDLAADEGTSIYAPADGTVIETGNFFFSGNCIFIDHGRGVISFYGHMQRIDVKTGQTIKQGQPLGTVGKTGRVTGPHLHWSIGLNGTWVDPNLFLAGKEN